MVGTEFPIEIQAHIPEPIKSLAIFANDLTYSWNKQIRSLFYRLDRQLWVQCGHNPKIFLRQISQEILDRAAQDKVYLEDYNSAVSWYENYISNDLPSEVAHHINQEKDLIAYFSAEFGMHESLPIYSGGLGILAGDHCKAASDLGLPFVAVGLLYHQGYFTQNIDGHGRQVAEYQAHRFHDLPITPVMDANDTQLSVQVEIADRTVELLIWKAQAGNINLFLLDSDVPSNNEHDRSITYQLYGGDKSTRIEQEIVLGVGGIRALRALNLSPNVWHINEGHAAFQIIERIIEFINQGYDYHTAVELVAANTIFTTHTPVPAGHDIFDIDTIQYYMSHYCNALGLSFEDFFNLGSSVNDRRFNMTVLALRLSRQHNGVSKIHGEVASNMESHLWHNVPADENPISYVTNGVHVSTFLAHEWADIFNQQSPDWRQNLSNKSYWKENIDKLSDEQYWKTHNELRSEMLHYVCERVVKAYTRNGASETLIRKATYLLSQPSDNTLVLGFARRFATYKRATLLFNDEERLKNLLNNSNKPVLLIFAGKAHPKDEPGQELIRTIHHYSQHPDFIGKIILLENYDMSLARKLVTGVDVWINTPQYPMEACGTSGQKAGINGVLNLSVLDGWWGEGYNGYNGWAVMPHGQHYDSAYRNQQEANDLIDILEKQVIPTYYNHGDLEYSQLWIAMCKESMKSTLPQFNSERMVMEYLTRFYSTAIRQYEKLLENNNMGAIDLAKWKHRITQNWQDVSLSLIDEIPNTTYHDDALKLQVSANLGNLTSKDVKIELLIGRKKGIHKKFIPEKTYLFEPNPDNNKSATTSYQLDIKIENCGLYHFKIRMYPFHPMLTHRFEMGYMEWI